MNESYEFEDHARARLRYCQHWLDIWHCELGVHSCPGPAMTNTKNKIQYYKKKRNYWRKKLRQINSTD